MGNEEWYRLLKSLEEYKDSLYQKEAVQIKQLNYTQVTEVINLLQQGEIDKEELRKYRQMWEEVKQFHKYKHYIDSLEYYEQKYFPKENINEKVDEKEA